MFVKILCYTTWCYATQLPPSSKSKAKARGWIASAKSVLLENAGLNAMREPDFSTAQWSAHRAT